MDLDGEDIFPRISFLIDGVFARVPGCTHPETPNNNNA
jgi:hypothetical protein